jgi:dihydroorotase
MKARAAGKPTPDCAFQTPNRQEKVERMETILITGGHVVDPANQLDGPADVFLRAGKIEKVGRGLKTAQSRADRVFDAKGMIVTPGLVDLHVHFREPGFEYKETIATGSHSAVAGGVTSVACMPNTNPPIDDQAIVHFIKGKAEKEGYCHVYPIGCISKRREGKEMAELGELKKAGAVALSDDGSPIMNAELMRRVMEYARMLDLTVIDHCEDCHLSNEGVMHEGEASTALGLRGIPAASETVMVARNILLAEMTGAKFHAAHVSTAGSVELIRQAKKKGLAVTAETCPHYWTLSDKSIKDYNANFKMNPPLRGEADVAAVRKGIREGVIDCLCTDHAPHASTEKQCEFDQAAFGIVGLETLFPLAFSHLVEPGLVSLSRAVEMMTVAPAGILGIPKGTLSEGADADVALFDLKSERKVDAARFKSKGRNTPFNGWSLKGWAAATIVSGEVKYQAD